MRPAVLMGLVGVIALASTCSCRDQPVLAVGAGAIVEKVLVQSSPPPFVVDSQWGGVSLSLLLGSFAIDATIELANLGTMSIAEHPTLYLVGKVNLLRMGDMAVQASAGLSLNVFDKWTAWDVGIGATLGLPALFMEMRTRVFVGWTDGAGGHPAGVGLGVDVGAFVSFPLI